MTSYPPEARLMWVCLDCGNELQAESDRLTCEVCGHVFVIVDQTRAVYSDELTEDMC